MGHEEHNRVIDYGHKNISTPIPPTPPASVKSFADHDFPNIVKVTTCQSRPISSTELAADWILKILALASAILFGIWAPVSYRLQDSGNKSSDEAQDRLMRKIDKLGEEMEDLKRQMSGLAALRALEFCDGDERKVRLSFEARLVLQK
jgi:hypothetical protein